MARFQGDKASSALYGAADTWLDRSLAKGQSIFSDNTIWTLDNIQALETWFTNNPDVGEGDFFEKLEVQLSECEAKVKQLAAEMLWLMLLCPMNIGPAKKRGSVLRVWSWSGTQLSAEHPLLSDSTLTGVGNAGTSFNTNRWRELAYCIDVFKRAFQIAPNERKDLFGEYQQLADWLGQIPESERRQLRHMLLHMLHPDRVERIFSSGERQAIVRQFTGKPAKIVKKLTAAEIDQQIYEIRQEKEAEFGSKDLDFYQSPLKELWKDQSSRSWLFAWNPNSWNWDNLPDHIAQTRDGQAVVMRWSCSNQSVASGDRAWVIRLGEEPKGIMATGNVVSEPYEADHYEQNRAEQGHTCLYVDIELTSVRDVFKDPFITMAELGTITIDQQQWSPQSSGSEVKSRSAGLLDKLWQSKPVNGAVNLKHGQPKRVVAEPINKILYGPPGTGKTYTLNKLKEKYIVKQASISHEQWLSEQLKSVNWFDVVFMCLCDLGRSAKVKEIEAHPFFVQKAKAVGRKQHLKAQIWATLQSHTIESSTSVKYKNRVSPLVFDKDSDSRWFLAGNWQEDCEDLIQQAATLREGAPKQADQTHYAFVTFHQAYSYEDFVEGIRPAQDVETDELVYRVEPGVFRQICQDAQNAPETRFALFIDEINRGNIAKIFGELITLIEPDKRAVYDEEARLSAGMELTLPYSRERFGVPKNLDIYGTMNTADRSIALLDTALRRRFRFEELMPNAKVISGSRGDGYIEDGEGGLIDLRRLLETINRRIRFLLNRDLTLGHAYLHGVKDFKTLRDILLNQLIPLLQEYFYNDWHRIQLVFRDVEQDNRPVEPQIIEHEVLKTTDILGFDHDDFEDLLDYRVATPEKVTPDAIRKIYEPQE
ncbi:MULTISPECIES: AAA family ATPase [Marinobacter]|uniref:AAA family ATPase n=1 Tax=Marinobacter TaxID=2742 RepID=UPI003B4359DC|nr:EVE domain-containing protein [Marinobacter alkaliphilus]